MDSSATTPAATQAITVSGALDQPPSSTQTEQGGNLGFDTLLPPHTTANSVSISPSARTSYTRVDLPPPDVEEGDVQLWDNWSVFHSAIDYPDEYGSRTMHQANMGASDAPVGVSEMPVGVGVVSVVG